MATTGAVADSTAVTPTQLAKPTPPAPAVEPPVTRGKPSPDGVKTYETQGAKGGLPPLRQAYVDEVKALEDVALNARAAGVNDEQTARLLHQMRRDLGEQYKNRTPPEKLQEIYARNLERYGDKLGPSVDWLRSQGKSWEQIIQSAIRPGGEDLGF